MSPNEHRIREFAYQIWESEGRPHGQCERHWNMACTLAYTQAESEMAANDIEPGGSTEPIEPISPTQPAQPVPPSDPIQPTDPVQPGQPVQPGSPSAEFAKDPAPRVATKTSRAKAVKADEVIARVVANEKSAAKKKSPGKGELNTDVKFKTDLRKPDSELKNDSKIKTDKKENEIKKIAKAKKTRSTENELS